MRSWKRGAAEREWKLYTSKRTRPREADRPAVVTAAHTQIERPKSELGKVGTALEDALRGGKGVSSDGKIGPSERVNRVEQR